MSYDAFTDINNYVTRISISRLSLFQVHKREIITERNLTYLDLLSRISQMTMLPNCKGYRAALSRLLETVYSDAC